MTTLLSNYLPDRQLTPYEEDFDDAYQLPDDKDQVKCIAYKVIAGRFDLITPSEIYHRIEKVDEKCLSLGYDMTEQEMDTLSLLEANEETRYTVLNQYAL